MRATLFVMLVCMLAAMVSASSLQGRNQEQMGGTNQMSANIALVGSKQAVVNPTGALDYATREENDIEEDDNDRFITKKDGSLRPILADLPESEWAEEAPAANLRHTTLSRKKRCNNNDDDDGDARRARRARRTRRTRARRARRAQKKAAKIAAKSTSTTVTRKVIQNGQVISQTTETQGAAKTVLPAGQVLVASGPVQPQTVVQTIPQQPIVVQQPAVVASGVPQVVTQQPAASQVVGAAPAISVQGSVKVN